MRNGVVALLLAAAVPSAAGVFSDDLMLRQRTYGAAGPAAAEEQRQWFSGDRIVVDDARTRSIVDLAARTWTMIDKRKRHYSVMTFEDLRQRSERAGQALGELPPAARRMLGLDGSITLKPTGRSEKIAGYTANEYALAGTAASGSVWASDELRLPPEARTWDELAGSLGGQNFPGRALAAELTKLRGVPLRMSMTIPIGPGKIQSTTEVIEVRKERPPSDLLNIPAGFEKVPSPFAAE